MKVKEKYNQKLLVEGNDDQHVVWALCKKYNIPENFDVIDCEGIDKLIKQIPVIFKSSEITTIGVIVDADTDLQTRWNLLKIKLSKIGFDFPDNIPEQGVITTNNIQKIGVWLMPDNNTNGTIEDFIVFLVPKEDKLMSVVDTTLENIEAKKLNKYSPVHKSKAKIHTWLAWQEMPGTPMGQSITKEYLFTDKETCQNFINWLTELFK
jgi:hypothetical protein